MAVQQLTLPGEIVKKRNELARSKISISNAEGSRILANLIACVRHDDTQFKDTYRVPVKDFISDKGGGSYSRIKAVCRELSKATAEIEEPDPDGAHPIFRIYTFFSSLVYRKGVVEARFNQEMQPLLLDLRRCFTQYNLLEYLTLPSIYSQKLFEILKSWANTPEVTLPIAELHRMLDTPDSFRKNFAAFRRFVLQKAHKDILARTSLRFDWQPLKQGRAVGAVRFTFGVKRSLPVEKEKSDNSKKKQARDNNTAAMKAIACLKERGPACEGGHQKPKICELCRKLR